MASFQAKIGWKRKKVKIIIPISSSLTCNREFQKNSKKKKKKIIMASFQAKIGWVRPKR